jgi:hypothetical protein
MMGSSRLRHSRFALTAALLTIASLAISARTALASGKIYYGSRVGMTVSVISVQALNTTNAVIRTLHSRDDAVAFCRDYEQNLTDECVNRELETPMNDHIAANCSTGLFVDFFGNRYRFEGPQRKPSDESAKYMIRDLSTAAIEDGSSASGYPTNLGIFRALRFACQTQAIRSLSAQGVEFTNGDQPGVRLRRP